MRKILIPGGTGLVGTILKKQLSKQGFDVYFLTRKPTTEADSFTWDPDNQRIDNECFKHSYYAIINTCGASIASKKWTTKRKNELLNSRIKPTEYLWKLIRDKNLITEKYFNLSATGYYGNVPDPVNELDKSNSQLFITHLSKKWETTFFENSVDGIDHGVLRLGVVLSKEGGFLTQFNKSLKFSISPYFGSGKDYLSWIHETDLGRAIHHILLNDEMQQIYNLTSPYPCTTKQLSRQLKEVDPSLTIMVSIPKMLIRWLFGEMREIILTNVQALPYYLQEEGFQFEYTEIDAALREVYGPRYY
ncbi:TIGR01777 family oxidoreductase [Membranihabitans marinus]|uniref:TIGR01777 family oxidoreductase n=1 Tax=Membranihabitans marinus TaxID=1227546 RepID=UPI001F025EC3|nr:TIGR01777 family oxidoreductase [Membranihabitans marinus]